MPNRHHTFCRRPCQDNLYIPAHAAGPGASLLDMFVPANNDAANHFDVHHQCNDGQGKQGLVEDRADKDDEHSDITAQPDENDTILDIRARMSGAGSIPGVASPQCER